MISETKSRAVNRCFLMQSAFWRNGRGGPTECCRDATLFRFPLRQNETASEFPNIFASITAIQAIPKDPNRIDLKGEVQFGL